MHGLWSVTMRQQLVLASALSLFGALLMLSSCDEGSGSSGNGGAAYQGPCASYTDCVSCTDAVEHECEWCAGACVGALPYDSMEVPGASCEWGWAPYSSNCDSLDGIYIQPTTLDIDCRAVANAEEPRCQGADQVTPGSLGAGPAFPADSSGTLFGGFVDTAGNRLVIGAYTGGSGVSYGSIWSVDLATGDRTLSSGAIVDPIQGELTQGSGVELGENVLDVEALPDGDWVAWTVDNAYNTRVLRVDPATGDRTLMYEDPPSRDPSPCAHAGLFYGLGSSNGGSSLFSIAVGSNGQMYLPLGSADEGGSGDIGIAAMSAGGDCTVVTLGSPDASHRKGGGPFATSPYRGIALDGSTLYATALSGQLHAVNTATGDRTLVSEEGILGEGPDLNQEHMTLVDGTLWTTGESYSSDSQARIDVDPASGDRTARHVADGPLYSSSAQPVFMVAHPTLPGVAVVALQRSIALYEASSGNSVLLSH